MDNQKDSRILDTNKGQNTLDRFSRYLSLKLEKLTSATYMVTDFLSDNEPIKWKLREGALATVTDQSLTVRRSAGSFRLADHGQIVRTIESLVTLLDIVLIGSNVSVMNFSVLKNEYQKLLIEIAEHSLDYNLERHTNSADVAEAKSLADLNKIDLARFASAPVVPEINLTRPGDNRNTFVKDNGYIKGQSFSIKDTQTIINPNFNKETKTNEKKGTRRETIVSFLKDKEWVGIMDISKNIKDCSTKTVQRELAELVKDGILTKQGEKRWSRYFLVP